MEGGLGGEVPKKNIRARENQMKKIRARQLILKNIHATAEEKFMQGIW